METKKTESQLENFVKDVDALGAEILKDDDKGFILFAYNELDKGAIESTFAVRGKLNAIAETLFTCMKQNLALANVILAASNAYGHHRMLESQMHAETQTKEPKGKKSKKVIS